MKRFTQSLTSTGGGKVYKDPASGECGPMHIIEEYTSAACEIYPSENGAYIVSFPSKMYKLASVDALPVDESIPIVEEGDIYSQLSSSTKSRIRIGLDRCFCPGEGNEREILTLGSISFPKIVPLPLGTIPSAVAGSTIVNTTVVNTGGGGGGGGGANVGPYMKDIKCDPSGVLKIRYGWTLVESTDLGGTTYEPGEHLSGYQGLTDPAPSGPV